MLKDSVKMIEDLFNKYNSLAPLLEKVDAQMDLLKRIDDNLSMLPKHQVQLAVLTRIAEEFDKHAIADQKFKEEFCRPVAEKVGKIDPIRIDADHDDITKMKAEWNLIKYIIPIIVTIVSTGLSIWLPHVWK